MLEDIYLQFKRMEYLERLLEMLGKTSNRKLLGYAMQQIEPENRTALHEKLMAKASSSGLEQSEEIVLELTKASEDLHDDPLDYLRSVLKIKTKPSFRLMDELSADIGKAVNDEVKKFSTIQAHEESAFFQQLKKLSDAFSLNSLEREIVTHTYFFNTDDYYRGIFSESEIGMEVPSRAIRRFSGLFKASTHDVRQAYALHSILWHARILERCGSGRIELADHIEDFLCGVSSKSVLEKFFEIRSNRSELVLQDFPVPAENTQTFMAVLRSAVPANILLHGVPGSGKTAFAECLARELGYEIFYLRQTDDKGEEDLDHRKTGLVAAQKIFDPNKTLLIVDECDPLLDTASCSSPWSKNEDKDQKSWMNHYFDTSKLKTIWITNRINQIDESTRRRFTCVQQFARPETRQRKKAWALQATRHQAGFLTEESIDNLSQRYTLGPGSMEVALKQVQATPEDLGAGEKLLLLNNILSQHQKFLIGKKATSSISPSYALQALKTDIPLSRLTQAVETYFQAPDRTEHRVVRNLNFLLMGPPGTGKTEYVKHLAQATGRDLIVKRASDLISKYIGETEKYVAAAFQEAESTRAILFLDEADSFFINRESAQRSWEVSQTNELLCQMENFEGVLACATNFEKNLDHAVMRRFAFKVKFDYLDATGKVLLFEKMLGGVAANELTSQQKEELGRIPYLSPGDFKVVLQQASLSGTLKSCAELMKDLEIETVHKSREKKNKIGLR